MLSVRTLRLGLPLVAGLVLAVGAMRGGEANKTPVPAEAAQKKALALVVEIFGDDMQKASTPELRSKLASELMQQGKDVKDDAALRYVLFREARDLAGMGGDAALAFAAIEELGRSFDVDVLGQKAKVLALAVESATTKDVGKSLLDTTLPLIDEALEADQFDAARALGKVAEAAARKAGSISQVLEVKKRVESIGEIEKGFARLQGYLDRIKKSPNDAEANLELGKYYAFLKRNWSKALPYFARSGDERFATIAKVDLAGPKDAKGQLTLADSWWEAASARTDPDKLAMQTRAGFWYDKALSELTGLNRTKAQKRLDQIAERQGGQPTTPVVAGPAGEIKKFEGHSSDVRTVAFSPDGRLAVSGGLDDTVRVWNLDTGKEVTTLRGHTKEVWSVAFLNQQQVMSASWDATVRLWDIKGNQDIRTYRHPKDVNGIALSRDHKTFLSGSDDQNMRLWSVGGDVLKTFEGHTNFVYCVAFAPDGIHVASGGVDRTVRLWELANAKQVALFNGHTESVTAIAFSKDSKYIFSAGDTAIHVWDIANRKEARRIEVTPEKKGAGGFDSFGGLIRAMALTPDGRRLVTGGDDGVLRVWDATSGKELNRFAGHTNGINGLAISADGRRVLTASRDRTVRLWGLPAR